MKKLLLGLTLSVSVVCADSNPFFVCNGLEAHSSFLIEVFRDDSSYDLHVKNTKTDAHSAQILRMSSEEPGEDIAAVLAGLDGHLTVKKSKDLSKMPATLVITKDQAMPWSVVSKGSMKLSCSMEKKTMRSTRFDALHGAE